MKFLIPIMLLMVTTLFAGIEGTYINNINEKTIQFHSGKWIREGVEWGTYMVSKDGKSVVLHATKEKRKKKPKIVLMKFEGKNLRHYSIDGTKKLGWVLVRQTIWDK